MVVTFEIQDNTCLAETKSVRVDICDLKASGEEMRFAADLAAAVQDFSLNYTQQTTRKEK